MPKTAPAKASTKRAISSFFMLSSPFVLSSSIKSPHPSSSFQDIRDCGSVSSARGPSHQGCEGRATGSRRYLVGVLLVVLLVWGPIDHSWPAWLLIGTGYLIAIPLGAWFLLGWIWRAWRPDAAAEDRLERALGAATGGALLVMAVLGATAQTHVGNTHWVRSPDGGMEAVGEDIVVAGPDWGVVCVLLALAGAAFWFSIARKSDR